MGLMSRNMFNLSLLTSGEVIDVNVLAVHVFLFPLFLVVSCCTT